MASGWFIVPYKRRPGFPPSRYCAMDDFTAQIMAAGGRWSETEVLGDRALVKVAGIPEAGLQQLAAVPGFRRLPRNRLDDTIADLPAGVRQAIRAELEDMGYTVAEIRERFGDDFASEITLRDVLHFMARRRRKPRWDRNTDQIVLDGEIQDCRPVDAVDMEVGE